MRGSLFNYFISSLLFTFFLGAGAPTAYSARMPLIRDPDVVCSECHQRIYDTYRETPMAHASGEAADGLLPGEFTHVPSGIHYRLFLKNDGHAWLSYERLNSEPGHSLSGEQQLDYFVGSGLRGRTYLFQNEGFWFESPVNWYGKQRVWDMNPKSVDTHEMPFTLKVDAPCLHCHSSAVQPTLPGATNHFAARPFLYGGITCESCHGNAEAHVTSAGKAHVLNPAELPPSRRDSVCLQCHLEGETVVNRRGHSLAEFLPGEELTDYVTHFVRAGESGGNGRATSQWEALLQSQCKKASSDRLTCITCHDPHTSPAPAQRVSYYRAKCLACHGQEHFVSTHQPRERDCISCHMPKRKTGDVAHEQLTDHRIQLPLAISPRPAVPQYGDLIAINGVAVSDRDLGLAYFQFAKRGNPEMGQKAMRLLKKAETSNPSRPDADLHIALGFLEQSSDNSQAAIIEYRAALRADPLNAVASGNLAILEAREGDTQDAIALLHLVSKNDPGETIADRDLATVECAIGDSEAAIETLHHLLRFSPDDGKAQQTLSAIENKSQHCGP